MGMGGGGGGGGAGLLIQSCRTYQGWVWGGGGGGAGLPKASPACQVGLPDRTFSLAWQAGP